MSSSKKPSNYDYYEYLSNSPPKRSSSLTKSEVLRTSSPLRSSTLIGSPKKESVYMTPSKGRSRSPVKEYVSPKKEIEEIELARALKEQIDLDRELENLKNDLALRSDFNNLDAFRFFDVEARGYITKAELKDGMNQFDVFPTSNDLYLFMRKFDSDNDGVLRYAEFSEIFTPKQGEYSSILNDRVPSYLDSSKLNYVFTSETKYLMKKVLDSQLSNEAFSEDLRQKLSRRPLFNIYEAFKTLDRNDNGVIDEHEFRDLLIDHGIYASGKELSNLLKRYDRNNDGKISYYEFVQELTPKSPSKY
jgi:Ca2+-binding EF-hand superfamily protein